MTPLAVALFQVLRIRTPKPVARKALISYAELVAETFRYPGVPSDLDHHKDPRVDAALLELTEACRADNLPPATLMITGEQPYTPHPLIAGAVYGGADDVQAKWEKDIAEVAMTFYPQKVGK